MQVLNFRPLYDVILVKRTSAEEKTAGGLFIPDSAKEKPLQGVIVAAGRGAICNDNSIRNLDVKVGDTVLFDKYVGADISIEGEAYLAMKEGDVIGVMN